MLQLETHYRQMYPEHKALMLDVAFNQTFFELLVVSEQSLRAQILNLGVPSAGEETNFLTIYKNLCYELKMVKELQEFLQTMKTNIEELRNENP